MEESEGKKEKSNKILNIDGPPSPEFQQLWEGIDVECHFRFPTSPPPWLDEKLYDAGIRFVNKNLVGVGMSNGEALVSGLCIPSFFNALTFSGETNAKRRALYRYRDTGMHIFVKWYQSKPWLPDSEAAASFKIVNAMHAHIANKIRAVGDEYRSILESKYEDPGEQEQIDVLHRDLENLREQVGELPSEYEKFVNNPIVFTQFDMGLVQSSFFGGPLLFPDWYGCSRASEADMAGFMHVWRVFGYYLGIEDRFNLAQFDVATTRALGFEYLDRVVKPCCLHVNKQSVFLGQKIFFEPSNYFVWIYRNYHMMGLELGNLWRSFSWQQTYWFYARYLFSYYFYPLLGVKQILNSMARRLMKTLLVKGKKK
eukprot:TRINITY_DN2823_c0_g1_i1.p1 TRINITY_DN2823_c0_g1~~TRINITY_DN2823_c0_g1_i1.p1  ORF type:complete len:369 (-),score=34.71 TRINITY_DN2823_c0_g1_i1:122-1228(-)